MPALFSRLILASISLGLALAGQAAWAAKPIPPAPYYYLLDEPAVIPKSAATALQSLLIEHDRAAGEQIVIAIFDSLDQEDRVDFTNRVFTTWQIGKRGKDNGVLIALYWKEHKSRIEVGYGLESVLTDARTKQIITDFLLPELKAGDPARALTLTTLEIMKALESPLIQNGKANEILKAGGLRYTRRAQPASKGGWSIWLFLGMIFVIIAYRTLTSAEAHFTGDGWYRPKGRLRRRLWGSGGGFWGGLGGGGWSSGGGGGDWGGGGSSSGGGFGGFSGGGGSSGGGGASGDW